MTLKLKKLQEETLKMRGGGGNALALSVLPLQEQKNDRPCYFVRWNMTVM